MIREEYKNAFLDEKNKKAVMIKFTSNDETIDAEDIVEQSSFKYTESSNDGDEIKLGMAESSSFEIDIFGDLSNKVNEEIYVEVIAYDGSDSSFTAYTIPIGYFIVSDVDYDYSTNKSHLLCYDKVVMEKDSTIPNLPEYVRGSAFILSNYYINLVLDNVPEEYYKENPPVNVTININPNTYYNRRHYYCIEKGPTSSSQTFYYYYVTEQILGYQSIEYVFDSSKEISSRLFFIIKNNANIPIKYYDTVMYDNGLTSIANSFWASNSSYNYNGSHYSKRSGVESWQYERFDKSNFNNLIYPSVAYPYKMSKMIFDVENGQHVYGLSFAYHISSGYRYGTYSSDSITDLRDLWSNNDTGVTWTNNRAKVTNSNIFPRLTIAYPTVNEYYGIPLSIESSSVLSSATRYQGTTSSALISQFAEMNGEMVKADRMTGELVNYSLLDNNALYPKSNIYPNNNLYPQGYKGIINISKDMYSLLIAKTNQSKKVGKVEVTKNANNTAIVYTAQIDNFDENKYATLRLSDKNFFVDSGFLDAQNVANNLLNMYKNYAFTPFELESTGLPWLDTGDWIVVETDDGQQRLNVNRRTLSGIQGMMDSLSAGGI